MKTKKNEKTETETKTIETIASIKLDNVTGGCAACGNPNHPPQPIAQR